MNADDTNDYLPHPPPLPVHLSIDFDHLKLWSLQQALLVYTIYEDEKRGHIHK